MLQQPFNRELAAGTLSQERFRFFMEQDSLYLREFSKAIALAAVRSPFLAQQEMLLRLAQFAIEEQKLLHSQYLSESTFSIDNSPMAPACAAYTGYLLEVGYNGTYAELMAAILACPWVYLRVGQQLARQTVPNNPYAPWLDTYTNPDFEATVQIFIGLVESAYRPGEWEPMQAAFYRASELEYGFWANAYSMVLE
ncbi:MAG: hypothetical protein B7X06_03360 [Verrucomicrobia bacterium 21-51-4]|nr:MAG: hypothetical protein B7X06_03360 [Verrucomicrobia bacterium 21-51-4]